MEIKFHAWGVAVRKSCSLLAAVVSLLCIWFCLYLIFLLVPHNPSAFVTLLFILLVLAVIAVCTLLGAECLWSKIEVNQKRREIRFLAFGRPRTVVPFDQVRDVAAEWDGEGILIPTVHLQAGRAIRFLSTQGATSRRNAAKINEAIKAVRQTMGLPDL